MAQILYVCRRLSQSIRLTMPGLVYIIAFSEFFQPGNADHRMINLSVAWLIMKSRLLHCYSYIYDIHWLLAITIIVRLKFV